jgi:phosphoglycerate dehydrogenase-like enzyme
MNRILVTPRSVTRNGHPSLQKLKDKGYEVIMSTPGSMPDENELIALLADCVGYMAGVEPVSARVIESAKELRVISRNGTGIDSIDIIAAERRGIRVLRTPDAPARSVAELTMALMFALTRSIPASDHCLKWGNWERFPGIELNGKILGIIGCGKIGKLVAGFASAIGMKVIAFDCNPIWKDAPSGFRFTSLAGVLGESDVLSLHCPSQADGNPLIDASTIKELKNGVRIINTARASLIDRDALLDGLNSGHISGAGLDVFEEEPPVDRRLLQHPRVIATPHIGSFTRECTDRMMNDAVENLIAALEEIGSMNAVI